MMIIALVAFREFLEAFLITGVFLGISRKLGLKKEKEIYIAAGLGIAFSLILSTITYLFGDLAREVLTERNADLLEGYLMTFSGFFIVYLVLSLHGRMKGTYGEGASKVFGKEKLNVFDFSLFSTVLFLVCREGVEIALFTASTSLFSVFMQNLAGLMIGFLIASVIGVGVYFAYMKFPLRLIFKFTEYCIVVTGAALFQRGFGELFEVYWDVHLSDIMPLHLNFLPDDETIVGHLLKGFFGLDREFSVLKLAIMLSYVGVIYLLYRLRQHSRLA